MKPNERRNGGWWRLARTVGLLVSLVGAVGFGAQGCSAGEEPTSEQSQELLIGTCDENSENCPEALTGTCGLLYCSGRSTCEFKADLTEGDKCKTDAGVTGVCLPATTPNRVEYLTCCPGCVDRDGRCRPGDTDAYCGVPGDKCDTCGTCSSCTEGKCVQDGDGTSCTNGVTGKCVSGVCCIGCIKAGTCYLNAIDNCGRNGGACADCDDDKPCTLDSCNSGTCGHTNVPGACDPGDACITGASCSGSTCTGQPKVCNDNNACTTDSCDSATGCKYTPLNSGACNDGNACTEGDSCASGTCSGTAVVCNDNNPCTEDTCDPDTGCKFTNLGEGVECNDGNDCSTGDRCTNGGVQGAVRTCLATGGRSCNDNNPCTQDYLADCSDTDCTFEPITGSCSTGNLCLVGESCNGGTCGGGTEINCDDENPCTLDTCDPSVGCVRTPQAGECNDGSPCTIDDACDSEGACVGTQITCTAAGDCYDPGECNENTGTCSDLRKPNDTPCGTTGTCQSGQCVGDGVVTGEGGGDGMGSAGEGNSSAGTGGTDSGSGGASGGAPAGEGGNGEPGSAGDGSSNGGSGGSDIVGNSGNGNGASPGDAGQSGSGEIYVRDPGGCSCSVPDSSERSGRAFGALALMLGLAYAARRRRHATF
jgi:MYXO-CTERM domain-containing protein